MKRQRGRNRTGGGGGQQTGGGKPGQNANRAFDSNGPDNVKVRGHAQHICEKYQQLARDAASAGDPVLAENYLQHGEHYFRTLRVLQPNRPVTDIVNRDSYTTGFDLDFEDAAVESAMELADAGAANAEAQAPTFENEGETRPERSANFERPNFQRQNANQPNQDRAGFDRSERQNGERNYNDRPARDFSQDRQSSDRQNADRQNGDRQNGDRNRYEGRQDRDRFRDRPNEDRSAAESTNGDARRDDRRPAARDRGERNERSDATPSAAQVAAPAAPEADAAPVLRSLDGGVSQAPAFLSAAPAAVVDEAERRPRARRARRPRDGGDAAPMQPETEDA